MVSLNIIAELILQYCQTATENGGIQFTGEETFYRLAEEISRGIGIECEDVLLALCQQDWSGVDRAMQNCTNTKCRWSPETVAHAAVYHYQQHYQRAVWTDELLQRVETDAAILRAKFKAAPTCNENE